MKSTTYKHSRLNAVLFSLLFSIILTIFPVASGVIVSIQKCNQLETYWIQGIFMYISVTIPMLYLFCKKIPFANIGFRAIKKNTSKTVLYFLPIIVAKCIFLFWGITLDGSVLFALFFFTLAIGLSEELYFRGMILHKLLDSFSITQSILISALFFGIVHASQAFSGVGLVVTLLTIANAILFGIIASELVIITKSLWSVIALHALFDYINWISLVNGNAEILVILIQSVIMTAYATYLWRKLPAGNNC